MIYRYDSDHDNALSAVEFLKICKDEGIPLTENQIVLSGYKLDRTRTGTVNFQDFELFWDMPDHAEFLKTSPEHEEARLYVASLAVGILGRVLPNGASLTACPVHGNQFGNSDY